MEGAPTDIRFVSAVDVRPLRREVLRVGMPDATVDFEGDDDPGTFHLAIVDSAGEIVAVSTWMNRPCADDPHRPSMQLRGMATRRGLQHTGLGGLLLESGFRHARANGTNLIWANARDEAMPFYLRHGFEIIGDGFIETVTRLPHHRVRRDL